MAFHRAWAAAGPYPGEVTRDAFGTKIEHRTVADLYAGDVEPFTQTVGSHVRGVPPKGRLADPLWRCSRYGEARSLHDYPDLARNEVFGTQHYRRNVDGPTYGLSAYVTPPVDFPVNGRARYWDEPLYSRLAYLDDPFYRRTGWTDDVLYDRAAFFDSPVHRRAALLDDPLHRRASYLDGPLTRRSRLDEPLFGRGRSLYDPLLRRSSPQAAVPVI